MSLASPALAGRFFIMESPRKPTTYSSKNNYRFSRTCSHCEYCYNIILFTYNVPWIFFFLSLNTSQCLIFKKLFNTPFWGAPRSSVVKNLPIVQETWVRSLDWEDPLELEMATHSSILAWKIPWTDKPGGLQSMGSQRVGHNWINRQQQILHFRIYYKLINSQ